MVGLLEGLLHHVLRSAYLMADGRGLPRTYSPTLFLLFAGYVLAGWVRHSWVGDMPVVGVVSSLIVFVAMVVLMVPRTYFVLVPIYLCVSISVDLHAAALSALDVEMPGWFFSVWEVAGISAAALRIKKSEYQ